MDVRDFQENVYLRGQLIGDRELVTLLVCPEYVRESCKE